MHQDGRDTGVGVYLDRTSRELAELFKAEEQDDIPARDECATDAEETVTESEKTVASDAQKEEALVAENSPIEAKSDAETRKKSREVLPKIDFTTARFYIPKPLKYRADVRFDRVGSSWAPAVATAVLMIFLTAFVCWLLPHVLTLVDGILSLAMPEG